MRRNGDRQIFATLCTVKGETANWDSYREGCGRGGVCEEGRVSRGWGSSLINGVRLLGGTLNC